jgi:hypothetical protein
MQTPDPRSPGDGDSRLSPEQQQARAIARGRRDAMRQRARRIRRAVAGSAAALFVAAFLGVYVQLASGHDPALDSAAKKSSTVSVTSAGSSKSAETSEGSGESSSSSESSGAGEEESSSSSEESGPSSVTTSQS